MWKASVAKPIDLKIEQNDDDWETDPDFVNDVTEQEQRWGSKTVEGSGRNAAAIDMAKLRQETEAAEAQRKQKQLEEGPNSSFGYGGKFGIEKDRMDSSAVGHDYIAKVEKHVSQTDYSSGFGGKFGVQTDRVDKSAVSWDHKEKVEKHSSQKDYSTGFGGKFGVQADRQDSSAVGWDHIEKVDKHESQKDYSVGFGGKFGVQADRQDKSAVGWDHHESLHHHESQTDHKKGFGGKFGVQTDRMDKSAVAFGDEPNQIGTNYTKEKPDIGTAKPSDLRAKFENMAKTSEKASVESRTPVRQLDSSKTAMFSKAQEQVEETKVPEKIQVAEIKQERQEQYASEVQAEVVQEVVQEHVEDETEISEEALIEQLEDTGYSAIALYDYEAVADDEISFDVDDVITYVEMIDEGWWRGLCRGRYGLFPANYVKLQE